MRAGAKRLRSAEPSRAIRGFDEGEVRALLADAAKVLDAAADEREGLQKELEQLRAKVGEQVAGKEAIGNALLAATRAGEEMAAEARTAAERIKAEAEARAATILEEATKASDEREQEAATARTRLEAELAAARAAIEEENAATRAELEREREQLDKDQASVHEVLDRERERAQKEALAQADEIVADARHEVESLQTYAQRMRSLLIESQRALVELGSVELQRWFCVLPRPRVPRSDIGRES